MRTRVAAGRAGRATVTRASGPNVTWSPDSRAFFIQRNDSRKVKELYLVNVLSEPRPTLSSYTLRDAGRGQCLAAGAVRVPARRAGGEAGEPEEVARPAAVLHALDHGLAEAATRQARPPAAAARAGRDRPAHRARRRRC